MSFSQSCILITGGCGFIGSHFIAYIFQTYPMIRIVNIDAMYYCANIENIPHHIRTSDRYTFIKANITNSELLDMILHQYQIILILIL